VLIKDHIVLAPMTSLELCTDHMLDFIGPDKPSSFCNYYVEPHLLASCGAFTFRGRMRPRAQTSSWEFDVVLVNTVISQWGCYTWYQSHVEVKCMLMSLKNGQPRCYSEDRVSPHKDYNSS
jgi:hypothetical protein